MNRSIMLSTMAIGLVAVMLSAGTMAYFSDTETSTGNTFTAGTLEIELWDGSAWQPGGVSGTWTMSDMKPGDNVTAILYVHNNSTNPVKALLCGMEVTDDAEGINPESETDTVGDGELDDYLYVRDFRVGFGPDKDHLDWSEDGYDPNELIGVYCGHLNAICGNSDDLLGLLSIDQMDPDGGANDVIALEYTFEFRETGSPQNDAQGDNLTFEYTLIACQEPCPNCP